MGAWGHESCSNDGCWDCLGDGGIHNIHSFGQEEADACVEHNLKAIDRRRKTITDESRQEFLGVVIWIIRHGRSVGEKYLKRAKKYAKELMDSDEHMHSWRSIDERAKCLNDEIKDIDAALANGGKLPKRKPMKGLFQRMAEKLSGTE